MQENRLRWLLAAATALSLALVVACGGGDGAGGSGGPDGGASPGVVQGELPPGFPEDFPIYPGLAIRQSSPLGERYIVEADSEDAADVVLGFYEEQLGQGRWEVLGRDEDPEEKSVTLTFTAPGFPIDGRLIVAEDPQGGPGSIVGIAMPIEAGEGE